MTKPIGWQRTLAFPIKLRDGHVIETMAQAAGCDTCVYRSSAVGYPRDLVNNV